MSDESARSARARARASWRGHKLRLDDLPEVELVEGEPAERIAMVTALTLSAWAMKGEPLPQYDREHAPGRVLRASGAG